MIKKILPICAGLLFALACNKSQSPATEDEMSDVPVMRQCASYEVLLEQLKADPTLQARMDKIEAATTEFLKNPTAGKLLADGTIQIPVVVNVLYKTTAENISAAQIQSQIDVLNKDFSATNSDYNSTPSIFQGVRSGSTGIKFVLQNIVRKSTTKISWKTDDAMKKSAKGGINPTTPTTVLNLWSCNMSGGILGYAQFPGGNSATDGVVIDNNAFGVTTNYAPYNLGRTATHEVGHWLNLRHIWGDATCGNDFVGDTPLHNTANYGCPTYPHLSTCSGTPVEMTMNYMDYTDDACMYMFTLGQKSRMLATFQSGGGRTGFAQP